MLRRRHVLGSLCCTVLGLALAPMQHASADDTFLIENLSPAASQRTSIISVYGTETRNWGEWELNALASYAAHPLRAEGADGELLGDLVGSIGSLHLMGTLGLASWLDFSVALPFHRTIEGADLTGPAAALTLNDADGRSDEVVVGMGNLRLVPRLRLLRSGGLGIGLVGSLFLPTGKKDSYIGDSLRVEPRLAIDYKAGDLRIAANLGYMIRKENDLIPGNQIDDSMTWGAGIDLPLVSVLHAIAEVDGWLGVASGDLTKSQAPMEWRVGPRIVGGGWLAQLGGGTALVRGIGAPSMRLYASLGYSGLHVDEDEDNDGILDDQDACPKAAEDRDGFDDLDGCPDEDNDGDGVADARDGAPNEPEDRDGFADDDGVPDLDNDNDGVLDARDAAPNDPEDKDGFEDEDGAPETDNDRDGVLDAEDKCPVLAGLPEYSGCAPTDSDLDGIHDRDDKCPRDAGPESSQGCPLVQVTATRLEIAEKIYFRLASDVIEERSFALLDAVAQSLATHPEVEQVSVEGHSDSTGKPLSNMELSRRRASSVVKYLVEKGVEARRLKSAGFGQTKPVATNDTAEGKDQNRRVEFVIVKRKDAANDAPPPVGKGPEAGGPAAAPDATRGETPRPEAAPPESAKPGTTVPQSAKPEALAPQGAKPEGAKPEAAVPEPTTH